MGVKVQHNFTPREQIERQITGRIQPAIENALKKCLEIAIDTATFQNQSNNLISSMGYVLFYNGEEVARNFELRGDGSKGDGAAGLAAGNKSANEASAMALPSGFSGFLIAGESYARYLEDRGFDVITGAWLEMPGVFENRIKK